LLKAKNVRNNEFYTQYKDIENELRHYASFLLGKRIYLPCDNPYQSQFFNYFVKHFKDLKLKQLMATCYDASIGQLSLFEDYDDKQQLITKPKQAYKAVIKEATEDDCLQDLLQLEDNHLTLLEGNGDFSSQECVNLMKKADVIVTNPPFSLFRVLLHLLVYLEKDFILLGPSQAIGYSETFQLFQDRKLFLGKLPFLTGLSFEVPEENECDQLWNGHIYKTIPVAWFTSFKIEPTVLDFKFRQTFDSGHYTSLDDNSNIINVDTLHEIPKDYLGQMAVPTSFLRIWNREEFLLLGKVDKAMVNGQEKFTRLLIQRKSEVPP
jgi:hypothetical protein